MLTSNIYKFELRIADCFSYTHRPPPFLSTRSHLLWHIARKTFPPFRHIHPSSLFFYHIQCGVFSQSSISIILSSLQKHTTHKIHTIYTRIKLTHSPSWSLLHTNKSNFFSHLWPVFLVTKRNYVQEKIISFLFKNKKGFFK